jgi:hypothetical protein
LHAVYPIICIETVFQVCMSSVSFIECQMSNVSYLTFTLKCYGNLSDLKNI